MATDKLATQRATYFSLEAGKTGITSGGTGFYNPLTKTVRIQMYARSESNIGTTDALAYVPEGYRPTSNYALYGMFTNNANTNAAYYGRVSSDGKIVQNLGSTIREVFLTGEWYIS